LAGGTARTASPSRPALWTSVAAGVAVVTEHLPPAGREVRFCLHTSREGDCIAGEVVGVGTATRGRYLLRIAFWEPCPDRIYRMAMEGHQAMDVPLARTEETP